MLFDLPKANLDRFKSTYYYKLCKIIAYRKESGRRVDSWRYSGLSVFSLRKYVTNFSQSDCISCDM